MRAMILSCRRTDSNRLPLRRYPHCLRTSETHLSLVTGLSALHVILARVNMIICRSAPAPSKVTDEHAFRGQAVPTAKVHAQREHRMLQGSCLVCGKQTCRVELQATPQKRPMPQTTVTPPSPKRLCVPEAASLAAEQVPICKRVCILGRDYTTLNWHLGKNE